MDRVSEDTNICSATQDNYLQTNDNKVQIPHYCQVVRFTDTKGNTKEMFFPKSLDLERPKRARTNFTSRQLESLEKAFAKNQYLVGKERKLLSAELDLSESQIKIWYQNRRTKYKRELFKEKERLEAKAESIATSNIMKLLQHKSQSRDPVVTRLKSNNPFFYNNCLWNDTNYFSDVYSTSILHK